MDSRLIAWARAVKSRRARAGAAAKRWPVLWLFTDPERLPDARAAIARLPKGLCGVVLRQDGDHPVVPPERIAGLCRARRLALVVAGDARLARRLGAGLHLRGGRRPKMAWCAVRFTTSSAHSLLELRRARRAGAALAFLSPCFPTASHPGAAALGARRWQAMARAGGGSVLALGGIDGATARRLAGGCCAGAAAIGALGSTGPLLPISHSVSELP